MRPAEGWGTDWQGNEVLEGDDVVFDPNTDEAIQRNDLELYLKQRYGFEFVSEEEVTECSAWKSSAK